MKPRVGKLDAVRLQSTIGGQDTAADTLLVHNHILLMAADDTQRKG